METLKWLIRKMRDKWRGTMDVCMWNKNQFVLNKVNGEKTFSASSSPQKL
jgi:hypothetical protein